MKVIRQLHFGLLALSKDTSLFWPLYALLMMSGGKHQSQDARSKMHHELFHQYSSMI